MKGLMRRDLLKVSALAPATTALGQPTAADRTRHRKAPTSAAQPSDRERLLFDFGWRFHFGNADDPAKDFSFGAGRTGGFQKTGNFLTRSHLSFDDSSWTPVNLPHDWVIGWPYKNDPALASKGFYPVGRGYPESSVGWYRQVFELPAADTGKRISVEFDGAYRDAMVVLNGFYIGRHSDGWFYEGAGLYRHVWLVKTAPVHVNRWGTFVRARVQQGAATISIRTEINNHSNEAQNVRVISAIVDASGREVTRSATSPQSIADWAGRTYEQQIALRQPTLWSLEEPHLYKLVTEVEFGGSVTDRYETRFGVRSLRFDPETGFYLNGKPVKVKGTCNHQDHAGVGVAVPDSVQHFRVRQLQEMGCNAYHSAHNPPAPELLDACDELGMLFLDETRMMSSNPEGLDQFKNLVWRDRNHPSVFMWSMGNEERESTTEFGLRILKT
jgi:beta-galactosidase